MPLSYTTTLCWTYGASEAVFASTEHVFKTCCSPLLYAKIWETAKATGSSAVTTAVHDVKLGVDAAPQHTQMTA